MKFKTHTESEAHRKKRTRLFMALFISVIMVMSILAIYVEQMSGNSLGEVYKGLKVTQTTLGYNVKNQKGVELLFDNHPGYAESINASFSRFYSALITFNPNEDKNLLPYYERAKLNLQMNFEKLQILTGSAISEPVDNSSPYHIYPVADCSYENMTVIYLTTSNTTSVTQENNCIIISGNNGQDLLLAKDALLYRYLTE